MSNPLLAGTAEKKVELPIGEIYEQAVQHLEQLKKLLPPQYKLTLIARNTEMGNADLVVTEDGDRKAIKRAVDTSTVRGEVV